MIFSADAFMMLIGWVYVIGMKRYAWNVLMPSLMMLSSKSTDMHCCSMAHTKTDKTHFSSANTKILEHISKSNEI